jgi:glyoxylase-like metal-dependent hydrolase (beta-lactamase superfamily II)
MKIYQHYSIFGFSNSYIVGNEVLGNALIVDPAELTPTMIEKIEHHHFDVTGILISHNHVHHIKGLSTILKIYKPTIYASNAKLFDFQCRKVHDGEHFTEAGFNIISIAVPGHSQDSIEYLLENQFLFTGDVLHAGLIGKTSSAFNTNSLAERIQRKLFTLPDSTIVFPGHGPPSTIGTEKSSNISYPEGFAEHVVSKYDFFV